MHGGRTVVRRSVDSPGPLVFCVDTMGQKATGAHRQAGRLPDRTQRE
jgi:hypothetical protein